MTDDPGGGQWSGQDILTRSVRHGHVPSFLFRGHSRNRIHGKHTSVMSRVYVIGYYNKRIDVCVYSGMTSCCPEVGTKGADRTKSIVSRPPAHVCGLRLCVIVLVGGVVRRVPESQVLPNAKGRQLSAWTGRVSILLLGGHFVSYLTKRRSALLRKKKDKQILKRRERVAAFEICSL